jgi:hypothetical protein
LARSSSSQPPRRDAHQRADCRLTSPSVDQYRTPAAVSTAPRASSATIGKPSSVARSAAPNARHPAAWPPPNADPRAYPWLPPSAIARSARRSGWAAKSCTTPAIAWCPYSSPEPPPRTTSIRSIAVTGTRFQYTQPPNGSFSGTPSASTRARLAPEAARPRRPAPCVVGLATRDEDRRNREKPGTARNASSTSSEPPVSSDAPLTTEAALAVSARREAERPAVTVRVSDRPAGRRTIRSEGAGSMTVWSCVSKPSARARSVTASASTHRRNRPSAPVRPSASPADTSAPATAAPVRSTTTPRSSRPGVG